MQEEDFVTLKLVTGLPVFIINFNSWDVLPLFCVTNASFGTTWCKLHKRFSNRDNCILSTSCSIISVATISIQIDKIRNWFCWGRADWSYWKEKTRGSAASEYNTSAREVGRCKWKSAEQHRKRWWDERGKLFRLRDQDEGKLTYNLNVHFFLMAFNCCDRKGKAW